MNTVQSLKSKVKFSFFIFYFLPFVFCLLLCVSVTAQKDDDDVPADVAPPPIKLLSKDEKIMLESQSGNIKKRTKVSLELMDARMLRAEKYNLETNFKESLNELAGFNAVLDNVLNFLIKTDAGKSDRSFITFEIYLRKQVPRLETIRREMPVKYAYYVGKIMKTVRLARAKAVEPLFDDTVVPNAVKKP